MQHLKIWKQVPKGVLSISIVTACLLSLVSDTSASDANLNVETCQARSFCRHMTLEAPRVLDLRRYIHVSEHLGACSVSFGKASAGRL